MASPNPVTPPTDSAAKPDGNGSIGHWDIRSESPSLRWVAALTLIVGIGLLDHATGVQISLSLFYVAPVFLVAWTDGRRGAWVAAGLCGVTTYLADSWSPFEFSHSLVPLWNAMMRTLLLGVLASVTNALRVAFERERGAARVDPLTGIANARCFYEQAQRELSKSRRSGQPLSIAYIDLDDFKLVNDRLGHQAGDELLRCVAQTLTRHLRPSDLVARLGGDEFAILLPESSERETRTVFDRLLLDLREDIRTRDWPASASVGAVVFLSAPATVEDMVRRADAIMYAVKRSAKGTLGIEIEDRPLNLMDPENDKAATRRETAR